MADPAAVAAMAGDGLYNRHSGLQQANLQSALPLLEAAARAIGVGSVGPVSIVDYGASQGRNSMAPMATAIDLVRAHDAQRPVQVVHTDLPSNDFTSLFGLLDRDPASYLNGRQGVFPSAIGRSYFDAILPPGSVDLGWSSNALHWMSCNPVDVADHGWAIFSRSAQARAAVEAVLAKDWLAFLKARAVELRPGGRLICQFMGRGPDSHGFEWMAGNFWQSIVDMEGEGLLSADETLRMTAPSAGRSLDQIRAPFDAGLVPELELEHLAAIPSPDPYWDAYQRSGDAAELGRLWAAMMGAANGPNFLTRVDASRDRDALLASLVQRVATRVEADPQRSRAFILILSIRKRDLR
ncbi:MAG: hypothetical protein EPO45_13560 [Sphingobium sp.]|jgi:cyclopropane-fatty-acyl-phospholipid synthase|uniref:SAM dependent carboxyl methyltransferase n=1 Tax=Sphingobium xenophagum TaxID=121428 RepID=A0A249MXR7_SPHXE|nr:MULTISPECIES: hypothetical protein [Sphingobium]MBU0657994.1 class I SAM-dependent methyltransferase [Alphaproteobacteria bacterium]ODT94439.1 MAG: hypothetical protein ABS86_00090 [Sphingobium sp. SCN 64-10]ASY46005.1 hypothetical protein CJD35_15855 [Sphingobium xenophagum]MBA4755525.1 hypothetical protein [Sphingobium sp.]MBS91369.1 hypothetical protein [Sphingobium sp.]|tara:strand:- start:228 stop:1286 length:1059 start_codon:yes stop_codon:yes gene_type:complete